MEKQDLLLKLNTFKGQYSDEAIRTVENVLDDYDEANDVFKEEFLEDCRHWGFDAGCNVGNKIDDYYKWLAQRGYVDFSGPISEGFDDVYRFVGWFVRDHVEHIVDRLRVYVANATK